MEERIKTHVGLDVHKDSFSVPPAFSACSQRCTAGSPWAAT